MTHYYHDPSDLCVRPQTISHYHASFSPVILIFGTHENESLFNKLKKRERTETSHALKLNRTFPDSKFSCSAILMFSPRIFTSFILLKVYRYLCRSSYPESSFRPRDPPGLAQNRTSNQTQQTRV